MNKITFIKSTSSKFITYGAKNMFEPNAFKHVIKMNFINFFLSLFWSPMLKSFPVLIRNVAHLMSQKDIKKQIGHPRNLNVLIKM